MLCLLTESQLPDTLDLQTGDIIAKETGDVGVRGTGQGEKVSSLNSTPSSTTNGFGALPF